MRDSNLYPGMDWIVYGNPQQLEYDLALAAGADPAQIRLDVTGADSCELAEPDDLSRAGRRAAR